MAYPRVVQLPLETWNAALLDGEEKAGDITIQAVKRICLRHLHVGAKMYNFQCCTSLGTLSSELGYPVTARVIVNLEPHFIVAAPKLGSQISAVYPMCIAVTEYIQFLNAILFARQCKVYHVNERLLEI